MQAELYELRKKKKMTQMEMAKIADVSIHTYRQVEIGKMDITLNQAIAFANYFKKDPKILFKKEFKNLKVGT